VILLDSQEDFLHDTVMPEYAWDADASVFKYPPISASGSDDPVMLFDGTLRECFQMVSDLTGHDRSNLEIETLEGDVLYNSGDIDRIIRQGEYSA
jgi:hypothetical protein